MTAVAPDQVRWLPLVADVAGVAVAPTAPVERLDAGFRTDRLREAVGAIVSAIAGPTGIIVVEDSHWLDESTAALLEHVGRALGPQQSLLVTRRPEGPPVEASTVIVLGPLARTDAEELMLRELPPQLASDAVSVPPARRCSAATRSTSSNWRVRPVPTNAPVRCLPGSVERLLVARIDRLPAAARALIRDAAVLGSRFHRAVAARVIGRDELVDGRGLGGCRR